MTRIFATAIRSGVGVDGLAGAVTGSVLAVLPASPLVAARPPAAARMPAPMVTAPVPVDRARADAHRPPGPAAPGVFATVPGASDMASLEGTVPGIGGATLARSSSADVGPTFTRSSKADGGARLCRSVSGDA